VGISHPRKNGTPQLDLSEDVEASVSAESLRRLSPRQLALERVIIKNITHYKIPLDMTDSIRTSFKLKLWRMGKLFSKLYRQTQMKGRQLDVCCKCYRNKSSSTL